MSARAAACLPSCCPVLVGDGTAVDRGGLVLVIRHAVLVADGRVVGACRVAVARVAARRIVVARVIRG